MQAGVYQNRTLSVGIWDVSNYVKALRKVFDDLENYFSQRFKSVHFEELTQDRISNLNFSEELPENIDVLMYPTLLNLLSERVNGSLTAIMRTTRKTGLDMLANKPRSISVSSIDDVADKWTCIGIITSLIVISFLLSIYEFHRKNSKKKLPKYKILLIFFKYAWDNTMILFLEPLETISKSISQRMLCGVWILACVVIISEVSGAMKSKYSFVVYDNIKSVDEIIPGSPWKPKTLQGQSEDRLFSSWAAKESKFKYIVDKMEYLEPSVVLSPDFYHDLKKEDAIFLLEFGLVYVIAGCIEEGLMEKEEVPILYVSEPIMELQLVYPISFEMSKSHAFVHIVDLYALFEFEGKLSHMYEARYEFHVREVFWHPQKTESEPISYEDIIPIINLFIYGQIIAGLTLIFEIIIAYYNGELNFRSLQKFL